MIQSGIEWDYPLSEFLFFVVFLLDVDILIRLKGVANE